jgi:hypothetical protein
MCVRVSRGNDSLQITKKSWFICGHYSRFSATMPTLSTTDNEGSSCCIALWVTGHFQNAPYRNTASRWGILSLKIRYFDEFLSIHWHIMRLPFQNEEVLAPHAFTRDAALKNMAIRFDPLLQIGPWTMKTRWQRYVHDGPVRQGDNSARFIVHPSVMNISPQ